MKKNIIFWCLVLFLISVLVTLFLMPPSVKVPDMEPAIIIEGNKILNQSEYKRRNAIINRLNKLHLEKKQLECELSETCNLLGSNGD